NVRFDNRYVFSGSATDVPPFVLREGADGLTRVDYRGNGDAVEVEVGPDLRALVNLPGNEAFARGPRGRTFISGATGAGPGNGVDSGIGRDVLSVVHTQTLYGSP